MSTVRLIVACLVVTAAWVCGPSSAAAESSTPDGNDVKVAAEASTTAPATSEAASQTAESTPRPRIAHVRLKGTVLDSPPTFSLFPNPAGETSLRDWLHRLAKARKDDAVDLVALEIASPLMSWAQGQELADAVRRLNEVKPVYAYLSSSGPVGHLVASAASHVSMEPAGTLYITGMAAELLFFRGTLDLLGVEPQMVQIGRFKGASESLTESAPTEEMVQTYDSILDDLYDQLCSQIAEHRPLDISEVRDAIDNGPISATDARRLKFVDQLITRTDWREFVGSKAEQHDKGFAWLKNYGRKSSKAPDLSNPFALFGMLLKGAPKDRIVDPTVAIIHADGLIVHGLSGEGMFGQRIVGSKTLVDTFNRVRNDDRIKAVVFRINSPGGSALASELIYQAVKKCAATKPVVVSISQVGGSGGYYIAVAGQTIIADASAIVGSIGVVGGKLAISGLLTKLGISRYEFTRGNNAGLWMSRPWTHRELAVIEKHATKTYDMFVQRVATGRAGRIKDIDAVAHGRIFTANQAVGNGLIDKVGGLRDAVAAAHKAAGIENSRFISLPHPRTLSDLLMGNSGTAMPPSISPQDAMLRRWAGRSAGCVYLLNLAESMDKETILTAMPYSFSIRPQ